MKVTGDTNCIVYPRRYFVPEDEGAMFNEDRCWCYGVDFNDRPVIFRINMHIHRVTFNDDMGFNEPVIGDNLRHRGENRSKEMPAIWNFFDEGEKNFFCAAPAENGRGYGAEGGVILISKAVGIRGEALKEARHQFELDYGEPMPKAAIAECGYARVLNQGIPEQATAKSKNVMKKSVALPLYGVGRLEMGIKKPSERSLVNKLMREFPDRFGNNATSAKAHFDQFRRKISAYSETKKAYRRDPSSEIKAQLEGMREELNTFAGVNMMREHNIGNRTFAKWNEERERVDALRDEVSRNPKNEDAKKEIFDISQRMDEIAVESGIADFRAIIFHPEAIEGVALDVSILSEALSRIYEKFTGGGSYGGAILRVMDNRGRTIPSLTEIRFESRYLGNRSSSADEDVRYVTSGEKWKRLEHYAEQGISFELVPFSVIRPPGVNTNAYRKISDKWLGRSQSTPMRELYADPATGEPRNTYTAIVRRRHKSQPDSAFMVDLIATGHAGESPNEYTMSENGKGERVVRPPR